MTLEEAKEMLEKNYNRGVNNPTVSNPIAWALYKTWRYADAKERRAKGAEK